MPYRWRQGEQGYELYLTEGGGEFTIPETTEKSNRYVVTYAQASTVVDKAALKALETYCEIHDAQLVVIPGLYRNPTSLEESNKAHLEAEWDDAVVPYLCKGRLEVGEKLLICGDVSINPTATAPTTGFDAFTQDRSIVLGHPRVESRSVASTRLGKAKALMTTGAITVANYSNSKAGKKAQPYHTIGALLIEVEKNGKRFYPRQLDIRDGGFYDLDGYYTQSGATFGHAVKTLTCGDTHVHTQDPIVAEATYYAEDSICSTLRPENIVLHDLFDHAVRNHHRDGDHTDRYLRRKGHLEDSVFEELSEMVRFLNELPPEASVFVVASNHNDGLDRWLAKDQRHDYENVELWHWLNEIKFRIAREEGKTQNACSIFWDHYGDNENVKFLELGESLVILGITQDAHGHKGPNGSRGSAKGFSKLGQPMTVGHYHAAAIFGLLFAVGTSTGHDLGYNLGSPSSWTQSHCLTYQNGARTLIHIQDNKKWRL